MKLQWHVIQVTRGRNTLIQFFDQLQVAVVESYSKVCDDASTPNKKTNKQTNKQTKVQEKQSVNVCSKNERTKKNEFMAEVIYPNGKENKGKKIKEGKKLERQ